MFFKNVWFESGCGEKTKYSFVFAEKFRENVCGLSSLTHIASFCKSSCLHLLIKCTTQLMLGLTPSTPTICHLYFFTLIATQKQMSYPQRLELESVPCMYSMHEQSVLGEKKPSFKQYGTASVQQSIYQRQLTIWTMRFQQSIRADRD